MDWSKAKNILIAALLITNLMLGMAIYSNVSGPGSREMNEMIQNTIRLLEDHDILVEEDRIPGRSERLGVLSVRYRTVPRDLIIASISESGISLADDASEEAYCQAAEQLLTAVGIPMEYHVYEELTESGDLHLVRFGTEFEGYFLDNAKIQVSFRKGTPEDISAVWAEPVSMGQNRKRVMPATTALVNFMTMIEQERSQDPGLASAPVTVENIGLVYWLEGYTETGGVSEDTAVPYWCIRYNDGKSAYIAAYEE